MNAKSGFTLIELLIVLVIIGILAAIAIPQFSATREKAYFAAMKSDVRNLASQQELYYAANYEYSNSLSDLGFVASEAVTVTTTASNSGWTAIATHEALEATEGCALYYGEITAPTIGGVTPEVEGQVVCTS